MSRARTLSRSCLCERVCTRVILMVFACVGTWLHAGKSDLLYCVNRRVRVFLCMLAWICAVPVICIDVHVHVRVLFLGSFYCNVSLVVEWCDFACKSLWEACASLPLHLLQKHALLGISQN